MEYGLVLGWWLLFVGLWLGGLPLAHALAVGLGVVGLASAFSVGAASNLYLPVRLAVPALPSPVGEDAARVIGGRTASLTRRVPPNGSLRGAGGESDG